MYAQLGKMVLAATMFSIIRPLLNDDLFAVYCSCESFFHHFPPSQCSYSLMEKRLVQNR